MAASQVKFIGTHKDGNLFFATLRQRVDNYFKENKISKHYNANMVFKTVFMLSTYLVSFSLILLFQPGFIGSLMLWLLMGFALAGIGMCVMHDANHGAYSSSSKWNTIWGYSINLIGGSVFNWKLQHNLLHHTYTNIVHMDNDIEDKLVMRFSPHTKVKWYHRFQFIYVYLFYSILTLYWALIKDFAQFYKYTKEGVNKASRKENTKVFIKIVLSKLFYFSLFIVLPLAVVKLPVFYYLSGFLMMQFVAGLVLSVIFQLAHTVENTSHPVPDGDGNIENNWAVHQLNTTANFSRKNKFISWYLGGLNFQVEHHLFPTICHVHYPAIAPIVKETAEEFGIAYLENETFAVALKSHSNTLKRFGKRTPLSELV